MSGLSSRVTMTNRATIERNGADTADWGVAATPEWSTHLEDVPCRVWITAGGEQIEDRTTVAVVEDIRLFLPLETDVTEQDRIATISLRGETVVEGPVSIRSVLRHRDHLELVLLRVS